MRESASNRAAKAVLLPGFDGARLHGEPVVGIDEVGRGPLAGPVVAAAVILKAPAPEGTDDSKRLSAATRERLYEEILAVAEVSVGMATVEEIDRHNILAATFLAMQRAFAGLRVAPRFAVVDGNRAPALPCPVAAVVGADGTHPVVSAASIVAKVTRDRMMCGLADLYPAYGFERNMGYGTPFHLAALAAHGPCAEHRMSFRPCREEAPAAAML